jgi:hypothetical protein
MSKTVGMVSRVRRVRPLLRGRGYCTWCGGALVDGIAVEGGRYIPNALVCQACDRLGARCVCDRG